MLADLTQRAGQCDIFQPACLEALLPDNLQPARERDTPKIFAVLEGPGLNHLQRGWQLHAFNAAGLEDAHVRAPVWIALVRPQHSQPVVERDFLQILAHREGPLGERLERSWNVDAREAAVVERVVVYFFQSLRERDAFEVSASLERLFADRLQLALLLEHHGAQVGAVIKRALLDGNDALRDEDIAVLLPPKLVFADHLCSIRYH